MLKSNHRLSEFFYYDPADRKHRELKKGLEEYQFLIWASISAISHLKNGDYEKFDALVGENSCQIRAIQIALIALSRDEEKLNERLHDLNQTLQKIEKLLETSINALMQKGLSLKETIEKEDIDLYFSDDEITLIESFLLSEMKQCFSDGDVVPSILRKERCSPSEIKKKYPKITYSFVEKLAKKIRVNLSQSSVEFVRKTAQELNDPSLIKMVGKDFELQHNNLACIPTFWSFKTLFKYAQKKKIPLLFQVKFLSPIEDAFQVVDEEFLYFKVCPQTQTYIETELEYDDLPEATCMIQGAVALKEGDRPNKTKWKEEIRQFSIMDIIFSMGADHRQYPDSTQTIKVKDSEYLNYVLMAAKEGFALSNPSKFFVQHIYCSQPTKVLSLESELVKTCLS